MKLANKTCARCKQAKPLSAFAKAARRPDGLQNWCRACAAAHQASNREIANAKNRRWRSRNPGESSRRFREAREQAIRHYSLTDPPSCACCSEGEFAFLVIDHIDGGGNAERRRVGRALYVRLRSWGWPPGYQVLCWNCNAAKTYQGICPHELARQDVAA